MKIKQISILCVVLLAISLILVACGGTSQEFTHPENYNQLSSMIGKTKEDVCKELGIKENELQKTSVGLYMLPEEIKYSGQNFEVYLTFDVTMNQETETLYGFWYESVFTDDTEQAAKLASELAEKLVGKYKQWELYEVKNRITEQKELVDFLDTDEISTAAEALDLSKEASDNIKEYITNYNKEQEKEIEYGLLLEVTQVDKSRTAVTLKYGMAGYTTE